MEQPSPCRIPNTPVVLNNRRTSIRPFSHRTIGPGLLAGPDAYGFAGALPVGLIPGANSDCG